MKNRQEPMDITDKNIVQGFIMGTMPMLSCPPVSVCDTASLIEAINGLEEPFLSFLRKEYG